MANFQYYLNRGTPSSGVADAAIVAVLSNPFIVDTSSFKVFILDVISDRRVSAPAAAKAAPAESLAFAASDGDFDYPGGTPDPGEVPTDAAGSLVLRGADNDWSLAIDGFSLTIAKMVSLAKKGALFPTLLKHADDVSLFDANDDFNAYGGRDVIADLGGNNTIHGGAGHDAITMSTLGAAPGRNQLFGDSGDDTIKGAEGVDRIDGGSGKDLLQGGYGNDVIRGGAGDDVIVGDRGRDMLYGGSGADQFVFRAFPETTVERAGQDLIRDFSRAAHDTLNFDLFDVDPVKDGVQPFKFIGKAEFSERPGQLRYEATGDGVTVFGDRNGDGEADFAIHLSGVARLTGNDFIL